MTIAMQRRMVDLRAKWKEFGHERPIHMRIGINTEYCNVGNFGSEERMDYTIIGGEVNLAARLEGISEPDGIMLAYETFALVKQEIEAEEQEPIHVKGIAREIRPYAVKGSSMISMPTGPTSALRAMPCASTSICASLTRRGRSRPPRNWRNVPRG